jgi:tRNA-2-methylthio-N6-dimethylallyladenosine synthase
MKRFFINTFGCQMNEHDSEKIAWIMEGIGYYHTLDLEKADIIIFNTCAVRKSAEDRVFGKLGELKELKRRKPELVLALCGCMMQREDIRSYFLSKHKHIDIVFGTNNINKLPQLLNRHFESGKIIVDIVEDTREIEESIEADRKYSYKSYVNIMYGCNNFCTYCIVPYTRGREKSREPESILTEIMDLASNGTKEITLLGQNVNSFGKTLDKSYNFVDLLKDINKIEGIERIRFMTSHPKDFSAELAAAYGVLENLSPHLHLPVQSGSNRILKLMNRNYTREDFIRQIELVRSIVPEITITTDLIVGFPGESEEDFEQTIKLCQEVRFDSAYTFLYSIREGTAAANMDEQIPDEIKHQRFQKLMNTLNPISLSLNKKLLGTVQRVLVEEVSKNDNNMLSGRTEGGKLVHFKGTGDLIGLLVNVVIVDAKTFTLHGDLV